MKIKKDSEESTGLNFRTLRFLEQRFGVFFGPPCFPKRRTQNQQFAVYDEDESYAGDIIAPERWFTQFSIENALARLFGRDALLAEEERQRREAESAREDREGK